MKLYIADNPTQAHLVCELLKQANIACEVRGEGLFGLRGELPVSDDTAPYIWLYHVAQRAQAITLIDEYLTPVDANREATWRCPQCGEVNEVQFALCWQCTTPDPQQITR